MDSIINKKVSYRKQIARWDSVCVKRFEHTQWGHKIFVPLKPRPLGRAVPDYYGI